MTVKEKAATRDLLARIRVLEHDLHMAQAYALEQRKAARNASDEAKFLHGVLLMHGIDVPERLKR